MSGVIVLACIASKWLSTAASSHHLPGRDRVLEALQHDQSEIPIVKQTADLPTGHSIDHNTVGLRQLLQASSQVRSPPIAVCCRASPVPIGSPTTTNPVAIPMRTCSGSVRTGARVITSMTARAARTALSALTSCASGQPK